MKRDRACLALLNYFKQETAMNVYEGSISWIKPICNETIIKY